MSDEYINIIPADPNFIPSQDRIQIAEAKLRELLPDCKEIKSESLNKIEFFHSGGNFAGIECPSCGKEFDVETWKEWMDDDYSENGFQFTSRNLPCCGQNVTLNDLKYNADEGFGRFSIEPKEPNIGTITSEEIESLEQALGCKLKIIYVRF